MGKREVSYTDLRLWFADYIIESTGDNGTLGVQVSYLDKTDSGRIGVLVYRIEPFGELDSFQLPLGMGPTFGGEFQEVPNTGMEYAITARRATDSWKAAIVVRMVGTEKAIAELVVEPGPGGNTWTVRTIGTVETWLGKM